ncbi:enoyl-CoA hydratase-related protein [Frankia sp. AgB32]|uniref:enoyl-CoA hydratase-related protein n=1 Tax=Frankia sp. AgB32 TaxID=631119 RepID=UPI00200D6ED4|nr:enoyl-CoA hydratase-related protein [Frankia sp. AgB32]MCK9898020.1 enoyl-CoA hydratase-related protein [Frankia sp. AgB32]
MPDSEAAGSELVLERRDAVLIARLNRPQARNALNAPLMRGIGRAVLDAEANPEIRVLIITATGDRAFCVGMDLKAFSSGASFAATDERGQAEMDAFMRLTEGNVRVPIIGAANGTAVGGGFELLLSCDLVVASAAAKFGLPEVKRGLIAAGGGVVFVGNRIPLALALELALTGDYIQADRAQALGLVNTVVPPEEVLDAALALAGRIAANGPLAVAASKEVVRLAAADPGAAWKRLRELQPEIFATEDAKEGAMSFIEKRTPQWKGR